MGRPSLYTPGTADQICERLALGETLTSICKTEGFPAPPTVILWANENREGFSERYARARELGLHVLADEILDISDDNTRDIVVSSEGKESVDYEVVARSKLRTDNRKWILSKRLSHVYGDKVRTEVVGADGGAVKVETRNYAVAPEQAKSMDEWQQQATQSIAPEGE